MASYLGSPDLDGTKAFLTGINYKNITFSPFPKHFQISCKNSFQTRSYKALTGRRLEVTGHQTLGAWDKIYSSYYEL